MPDYIYGNSLKEAKSKANYLFEGEFRRRPDQNLSGASRGFAREDLLRQVSEQRQNRINDRLKVQASIKIQALWRGYKSRKQISEEMIAKFDVVATRLSNSESWNEDDLNWFVKAFVIHHSGRNDESNFDRVVDIVTTSRNSITQALSRNSQIWLFRLTRLLRYNLRMINQLKTKIMVGLKFLESFTRPIEVLNKSQSAVVWAALAKDKISSILRRLVDETDPIDKSRLGSQDQFKLIVEIIRRFLDSEFPAEVAVSVTPIKSFFVEFLRDPFDDALESLFDSLIRMRPAALGANYILSEFGRDSKLSNLNSPSGLQPNPKTQDEFREYYRAIWLCYLIVKTINAQINELDDAQKAHYVNVLANMIVPASHITNRSMMQSINNQDQDQNQIEEEQDELGATVTANHLDELDPQLNNVITMLVSLINEPGHVNSLKMVITNPEFQPQIQTSVVQLCNLMLCLEPRAIFHCRALYTVAFSREFVRHLWKTIVTMSGNKSSGPIYLQITKSINVDRTSWTSILNPLKLFCSLYSYLLPTLDDEEFTQASSIRFGGSEELDGVGQSEIRHPNGAFFANKELMAISSVLRDMCHGFIEILYQRNRQGHYHSQEVMDADGRWLSFEKKICFKAMVRLICQLYARDARKQFCPSGHWICNMIVIPSNEAVDFQLVNRQKGRMISKIIQDDDRSESLHGSSGEIKTALILQEIPFVVAFHDRVQIFHRLLREDKTNNQQGGYHFALPGSAIQVKIRRNYIYEDAFEKLSFDREPNLKLPLRISLTNAVGAQEAGVDGGGLTKEFLSELLKAAFDPMRGFFKATTDQHLYPNPSAEVLFSNLSESYETHYEFIGRVLGKAIFEKIMVELPLANFFLAKLLARKHSSDVDIHNLASLDPVLYKNLCYLKNYSGDVTDLNLDFTISNNELGEHEILELKPGGSKIPVTKDNRIEYVHLVAHYRLNKQIRKQCAAFKRGLSQLIDLDWLRMFDPKELQIIISGAPTDIDVEDWRRHTVYSNGYTYDCQVINIFWRAVSQFDETQKRKLLKFATSCSLAPLLGFKDLVPLFAIMPSHESRLPTSSTCVNLLKLPACEDESTMRSKLLYAIESNSGFDLS